jgi:hypothetical protein
MGGCTLDRGGQGQPAVASWWAGPAGRGPAPGGTCGRRSSGPHTSWRTCGPLPLRRCAAAASCPLWPSPGDSGAGALGCVGRWVGRQTDHRCPDRQSTEPQNRQSVGAPCCLTGGHRVHTLGVHALSAAGSGARAVSAAEHRAGACLDLQGEPGQRMCCTCTAAAWCTPRCSQPGLGVDAARQANVSWGCHRLNSL